MPPKFNTELLLLARQYRGLSQSDVAAGAGLDQGHYSRVERGLLNGEPSSSTVSAISAVLNFPTDFFFQGDEISGLPLSVHDVSWRKRASVLSNDLKRLHAELNLRLMHLRRLLTSIDLTPELVLPRLDVDELGGADKVAQYLRRAWMVPDGPIRNLTALCERAGILVITCDFAENIDGLTMRLRDIPPIIFLNRKAPADRRRHSLAHELGHLIMHAIPTEEMEAEADLFAGEFLVPMKQLRSDLIGGKVTLERLVQLKSYWRVSVASLLFRAGSARIITENQSSYLWRQLSARGWRKTEPAETQFAAEPTKLWDHIITLHTEDLRYSVSDFAKMLALEESEVSELYGIRAERNDRPTLRVVK
ncbi:XRE family transcriptional regulator [Rhizobium sp.]|uniref:helix-turn-helix domain-containing protein n=1 Tax=Rhizobium sp. TaxID=391 RepID=UPI0028A81EF6